MIGFAGESSLSVNDDEPIVTWFGQRLGRWWV